MIHAKEAREIRDKATPTQAELETVERAIKAAAATKYECFVYQHLSEPMTKVLHDNGYKVETLPDVKNEGPTVRISWKDTSAENYYNK